MQLITKPFTFDLLTAKVREMIRAAASQAEATGNKVQ